MENKILEAENITWRRVSKQQAERNYKNGDSILLKKNLANVQSPWHPYCIIKHDENESDFTSKVNQFDYYNSTSELGRITEYYIPRL